MNHFMLNKLWSLTDQQEQIAAETIESVTLDDGQTIKEYLAVEKAEVLSWSRAEYRAKIGSNRRAGEYRHEKRYKVRLAHALYVEKNSYAFYHILWHMSSYLGTTVEKRIQEALTQVGI